MNMYFAKAMDHDQKMHIGTHVRASRKHKNATEKSAENSFVGFDLLLMLHNLKRSDLSH